MHACVRICVEFDLGKGLPEDIKIKVDHWTHIQQLDYEQLPFKCKGDCCLPREAGRKGNFRDFI